jgi:hypothetical protein
MLLPRRLFLFGSATTTSTLWWWSPFVPKNTNNALSLDDWADLICADTPESFRQAVQQSHHFLYRGADDDAGDGDYYNKYSSNPRIQHPEPDLLIPGTYDTNTDNPDDAALDYFQGLEKRLLRSSSSAVVDVVAARPSTGHIATSDPMEASRWGPVVSVWPLGNEWSYVWPQDRKTLLPAVSSISSVDCDDDDDDDVLVVDRNLLEALQQPREVLFASYFLDLEKPPKTTRTIQRRRSSPSDVSYYSWRSAFLTIPMQEDAALRQKLQERNYGL